MEKTFNWKLYNTNMSECIGWYFKEWIYNEDIYKYSDTNLYITDDNQFLLHIEEWFVFDNNMSNWYITFKYEDLDLLSNEKMTKWLKENNFILRNDKIYSLTNTI